LTVLHDLPAWLFFITTTDRPYRGAAGVAPSAYELVLHELMERTPAR
jgi:hypothetical protein